MEQRGAPAAVWPAGAFACSGRATVGVGRPAARPRVAAQQPATGEGATMPIPLPTLVQDGAGAVPGRDRRSATRHRFRCGPRLRYAVRPSFAPFWAAAVDL